MSFYLARLEAARQQHRMMAAAAAAGHAHAHAPRAWPPYPQHAALLLPRPHHAPVPPPPPPLHAGIRVVDTWRGAGSVARRDDGAPLRAGRRGWFGDGCDDRAGGDGRRRRAAEQEAVGTDDAAPALPVPATQAEGRGSGGQAPVPARLREGRGAAARQRRWWRFAVRSCARRRRLRRTAQVGKVDSVLFEAASSPSAAAASAGGSSSISALENASASDGGHHCQGERLVKSTEALGTNGVAAAAASALMDAADSQGVAGPGSGEPLKSKDCLVSSVRLLPKPTTTVSANRRFPPGCRRFGAPLPAGDGTTNQVVCLPSPEEVVPTERDDMEFVVRPGSHVSSSVTPHEATACRLGASVPTIGNKWHCEERRSSSAVPASGANVTNKPGGSSCNVAAAESLAQGLSKEGHRSDSVSDCSALNTTCSDDFAAAVSGEGAVVTKKVMHTARKSVRPPRLIQKSLLHTQRRSFSVEIERETELGCSVNMNDIEDTGGFTKARAIQDPMCANKSPWTKGNEAAFFGPKERVSKKKLMNKRRVTVKGPTSACALDDKEDSILEDDEIFKALAAHETKFEYGPQSADARIKVKIICTRFESICRAIVQAAGQRSMKVRRIDLAADKLIRKLPGFTKQGPVVGSVPGVEVGDEFLYRVQLALVGLHRPFQGGIDSTSHEKTGVRIAISVVASGGYPDELSCSGELVYTGSGKKDSGDQKLEHGNLALKNCIKMKTPVRVIHGFKDQNREEGSHSRAREISTFTYDGLYHVVDCWREGSPGSKVFKYKLQRIPGQPQLSLHMAKAVVKNSMRPGFIKLGSVCKYVVESHI